MAAWVFLMYGWMVSNNLPFHPTAQCTMGTINIYWLTSSKSSVFAGQCRWNGSMLCNLWNKLTPLFRSLTKLRKVLLVPNDTVITVNEMRYWNLDAVRLHRGTLRRALPTLLGDWGQPQTGFDILLYQGVCPSPILGVDTSFGLLSSQDVCCLAPYNALHENFWPMDTPLLPRVTFTLDQSRLVSPSPYGFSLLSFPFILTSAQGIHWLNMESGSAYKISPFADKREWPIRPHCSWQLLWWVSDLIASPLTLDTSTDLWGITLLQPTSTLLGQVSTIGCCWGWTEVFSMDAVQAEPVVPTIGLTAGRDADITVLELESLLVTYHWFELHTPVTRSIPRCHIHSRPPGVLMWWYSFSISYCWCVVTPTPTTKMGMIGSLDRTLFCLDCALPVGLPIYSLAIY